MRFKDHVREDRRLQILLLLESSGGYGASHFLLHTALNGYGHEVSMDTLVSDLSWLEQQALLNLENMNPAIIARLTQRGADVALGRVIEPGIKRPQPVA